MLQSLKNAINGPNSDLIQLNDGIQTKNEREGECLAVDIVAIHGLPGNTHATWTDQDTQALWLRDFLPHDIPGARILTYSYPSESLFSKSDATLQTYALKLLDHLHDYRSLIKARPIIFVAHSLGGIVCKRALILTKEDSRYHDISRAPLVSSSLAHLKEDPWAV